MRISDWSSDVCSSDLLDGLADLVELAKLAASGLFDALNHIGFGRDACRPLVLRLQDHEGIGNVRRHRVGGDLGGTGLGKHRSEEHTSELQSLMRISYAVFCLKKKNISFSHLLFYIFFISSFFCYFFFSYLFYF